MNSDMFDKIFQLIDSKALKALVRWMPSHLKDEDPLPPSITRVDVLGNRQADLLAGQAATRVQVPLHVSTPIIYYYGLTRRLQRRFIDIICNLPSRPKRTPAVIEPHIHDKLENILATSSHIAYISKSRVHCARCHNSFAIHDPAAICWIRSLCTGIGQANDRPLPLAYESLHIGDNVTHFTHSLMLFRGLVYCGKCGAVGTFKLHKLARPCLPPTQAGINNIKAIRNNKLPLNVPAWPADRLRPVSRSVPSSSSSTVYRHFHSQSAEPQLLSTILEDTIT